MVMGIKLKILFHKMIMLLGERFIDPALPFDIVVRVSDIV